MSRKNVKIPRKLPTLFRNQILELVWVQFRWKVYLKSRLAQKRCFNTLDIINIYCNAKTLQYILNKNLLIKKQIFLILFSNGFFCRAGQRCFCLWSFISNSSKTMRVDPKPGDLRTEINVRLVVRNKLRVAFHNRLFLTLSSIQDSFYTALSAGKCPCAWPRQTSSAVNGIPRVGHEGRTTWLSQITAK